VYSYPRDIESVRNCIANAVSDKEMLIVTLADQGFSLAPTAGLMPIYAHRFVVCDGDPETSIVLSVWDSEDAIIYGYSLQEYLEREFLGKIPSWAA